MTFYFDDNHNEGTSLEMDPLLFDEDGNGVEKGAYMSELSDDDDIFFSQKLELLHSSAAFVSSDTLPSSKSTFATAKSAVAPERTNLHRKPLDFFELEHSTERAHTEDLHKVGGSTPTPSKRAQTWHEPSSEHLRNSRETFDLFELKRPTERPHTQESPPQPKRAQTWQEISSEINRFAAENMKNEGWDLWTCKKKPKLDETLSYLSSQSPQFIRKAELVFQGSLESQQKLQDWDKKMGLKRSHSRTMTQSSVTRKKLLHLVRGVRMQQEKRRATT